MRNNKLILLTSSVKPLLTIVIWLINLSITTTPTHAEQAVPQDESQFYRSLAQQEVDLEVAVNVMDQFEQLCPPVSMVAGGTTEKCAEARLLLIDHVIQLSETVISDARAKQELEREERAYSLESAQLVLNSQSFFSKFIFWMTIVITGIGVLASVFQFILYWRHSDQLGGIELELGHEKVTLKTAWLGVVMFGMSIGFFAIYVIFVFQVSAV